jgi:hypothetical protein
MRRFFKFALCGCLSASSHAAETWWKSFGQVEMGEFRGGYVDEDKKPDENTKQLLRATHFEEWDTFEDELVRISYPKHPGIRMKVNAGKERVNVEGGVCTTVDNSFQRAYELKAGPFTFGVFLVAQADWLDDGICMCGPMVHHVYRMKDGCLERFSLLPGGAVKKAQILGGKLRLMAFEWTHLACQRGVYEEMVERMALKTKHSWTEAQFQEETARRYGMSGRCGWLHPGDSLADANRIMGSPGNAQGPNLRWTGMEDDYPCELTANFKDDRLVRLVTVGVRRTGEPAAKGTYNWVNDLLEEFAKDPKERSKSAPQPTPERIAELTDATAALADKLPEIEWWRTLGLIDSLTEKHRVRDERLVAAVLKHSKGDSMELGILRRCGHKEIERWIGEKLTAMARETPSTQGGASMFVDPVTSRAEDAAALLRALAKSNRPAAAAHARALFDTPEPAWTLAVLQAVDAADEKPLLPAQELAVNGLRRAREQKSEEMTTAALELIKQAKNLTDVAEIEKLIRSLPESDADSYWEKDKAEALKALKASKPDKKDGAKARDGAKK